MLGIGVAEHAGFIRTALRALVLAAPRRLLTAMVVFAGILSHAASDVGYVVVVPLAGLLFLSAGRHPLVGLAAAFAGVSGGFSANLILGPTDALLAGITQEAAHIVSPSYDVTPAANWYFMAASAVLLTVAGTLVTERLVAPRLGEYRGPAVAEPVEALTRDERRGLRFAAKGIAAFVLLLAWGIVPEGGWLRNLKTGGALDSPLLTGVVSFIFAGGLLVGLAYGLGATLSAVLDLLIGSASAKWVLMAPVFVPMLMLLGYSPELTQAAYRIGDSVANVVTPLMSYFVVIVSFVQRYEPRAGIGTVGLLVVWMGFGWPLGPGAPLFVPVR